MGMLLLVTPDWTWPIFRAPQTARAALFPGAELRAYGAVYHLRARGVMRRRQHSRRLTTCVRGRKTSGSTAAAAALNAYLRTCGFTRYV